jgi:hypothetical protein
MKVNVIAATEAIVNTEPNSMEEKKGFVVSGSGEAAVLLMFWLL